MSRWARFRYWLSTPKGALVVGYFLILFYWAFLMTVYS